MEKEYLVMTNKEGYQLEGKESLKKKVEAFQKLGINFEVYELVNGETRKVLVDITDFVNLGVV